MKKITIVAFCMVLFACKAKVEKIKPTVASISESVYASALIDQVPFNTASLPTIKTYPIDYNPKFYIIGGIFQLLQLI